MINSVGNVNRVIVAGSSAPWHHSFTASQKPQRFLLYLLSLRAGRSGLGNQVKGKFIYTARFRHKAM